MGRRGLGLTTFPLPCWTREGSEETRFDFVFRCDKTCYFSVEFSDKLMSLIVLYIYILFSYIDIVKCV